MSSLAPAVLDNLRLTHDVVAAIRAIGEGKGKQDLFKERAPDLLENLRQVAIIESTESSNRLEGITLPRTAIEALVRRNNELQPVNRSEGEIAGYRNLLQLIHERHEYMELTPNLVLQLHRGLFRFSGQRTQVGGRQSHPRTAARWLRLCALFTDTRLADAGGCG